MSASESPEAGGRSRGKVLVLGRDTRSFLAVIRSLGRRGLAVDIAWCPDDAVAARSRYVHRVHRIPPYAPGDPAWLHALLRLLAEENYDLVIPCNDPSILPLRFHREEIERRAPLCLPGEAPCEVVFDKIRTAKLAASLGIPLPRQRVVRELGDLDRAHHTLSLPVVLKPRSSYRIDDLTARARVRCAASWDEASEILSEQLQAGEVLVQERFPGVGVGVEVLADQGELLLAFQHVRLHEPPGGGGSSYRESVPVQSDLRHAAQRLLGAIDYTGVAMVEFRVDPATGRWILVEINGRFWGSLPLAVAAGADFPYHAYQLFTQGRRAFPVDYRTGLCARNLALDLAWLRERASALRRAPLRALRLVTATVGQAAWRCLTLRERSDTFVWDDPVPGLVELAHLVRSVRTRLAERLRLWVLTLSRVRARRRRRLLKRLRAARSALFVCKGNICRSPFAERYARTVFEDGWLFQSCGHLPPPNRPAPTVAVEAAASFGVDLADHRSRLLTPALLEAADIVFTFDERNRSAVLHDHPAARSKTFHLGLLDAADGVVIQDPLGGGPSRFHATYARIARALAAGAKDAGISVETACTQPPTPLDV